MSEISRASEIAPYSRTQTCGPNGGTALPIIATLAGVGALALFAFSAFSYAARKVPYVLFSASCFASLASGFAGSPPRRVSFSHHHALVGLLAEALHAPFFPLSVLRAHWLFFWGDPS